MRADHIRVPDIPLLVLGFKEDHIVKRISGNDLPADRLLEHTAKELYDLFNGLVAHIGGRSFSRFCGYRPGFPQETYQYPSKKAMKKIKAEVKKNVNSRSLLVAREEDLIKNLNPKITGWKNYYSTKTSNKWLQALDWYIICTFTRWYNKKHQRRNHMSKVRLVRNNIYEKGLKKVAIA